MMKITREAYEAGRVWRRDGGRFKIHAFSDETKSGLIIGEFRSQGGGWYQSSWAHDGTFSDLGNHALDLVLFPSRVKYLSLAVEKNGAVHQQEAYDFDSAIAWCRSARAAGHRVVLQADPIETKD